MYTEHFGLEKAVFDGGIAQNDDLYLGPQQQRVAANLKIGLTTRDSVVTLTGALGVGKTTIAAQALRITATRLAQTWIGNTPLDSDELLELLLSGFELGSHEMRRVQRIQTWRQFMSEMSVTDTRICVLVENALALGLEGLQTLEALTAADPNDCPGANLVLMGPAELNELIDEPGLAPLKQRIRSRQRLGPMTPQEVEQYLRHRLTVAGGDYDKTFAPGTAAMLHCFSGGIPRMINNVCETALTVAATRRAAQLSPEIVKLVAESVYSLAPNGELPEIPAAAAPASAPEPVAAPVADAEPPAEEQPTAGPSGEEPSDDEPPIEEPAAEASVTEAPATEALAEPAEPEPMEAAAPESVATPVAAVEPPAEEPVLPPAPAPVATPASAEAPTEASEAEPPAEEPAAAAQVDAMMPVDAPEPPVVAQAPAESPEPEPQQAAPIAEASDSVEEPGEPSAPSEPRAYESDADLLEALAAVAKDNDPAERSPEPPAAPELPAAKEPSAAPELFAATEAPANELRVEPQEAVAAPSTGEPAEAPAEPPVLTEAFVEDALAEAQNAAAMPGTAELIDNSSDLPVLMDAVDFQLPSESENAAANAPPAATLPADAPTLPESELEPDEDFSEDFAAATHLHEISDEMAEMLFSADPASSADPATSATGVFEAIDPLDSDEIGSAIERTAVVEQLNEDDGSESESPPPAANTLVF